MLLVALGSALAAGLSTDIELVRPVFSEGALPGIDGPTMDRPGTVRVGSLVQYERDPLLLYREDTEIGAVVHNRVMAHLGVSVDLSERLSARLVVPVGGQWGSEIGRLGADTSGFGDLGIGGRFLLMDKGWLATAVRADVLFPFGTSSAFMGEEGMRGVAGVLAEGRLGVVRGLADVSITGRGVVSSGDDFDLGSELNLTGGAMVDVWPRRMSLGVGAVHRAGLAHLWEGGAENPVELLAGAQVRPTSNWQVDVGVGRGVAAGYGTTQFRGFGGVTWTHRRPPQVPRVASAEPVRHEDPPEIDEVDLEPPPDPPVWKPQELARVEEKEIVIRDPIQFELGTDRILPASLPTLKAVADLMTDNPEIAHLVVEGHASDEGDFLYNYDLSVRRALAIFRELVAAGVHPGRVSCRGMGEVQPVAAGSDETALAANRRVVFSIAQRLHVGDKAPELPKDVRLPWSGDPRTFALPAAPAPPPEATPPTPPPPGDTTDPTQFNREEDDE